MLLDAPGTKLREAEIRRPELRPGEVRIRVGACGVCRTDLHIRDGELADAKLPLVLGHQIVGTVIEGGELAAGLAGRRPVAGLDVRHLPLLPLRARESVRPGALHGLHPRRRLRRGDGRRRALLPAASRRPLRRAARAASLRGADRLPRSAGSRRRRDPRPLRLRRRRPHRRAAGGPRRTPRARLHAARRRGRPVAGARGRRRVGRSPSGSGRRSWMPRSSSRPPASSSRRRWRRSPRAARSSARAST